MVMKMRIIDICEGYSAAGVLKKYYVEKGIRDYNIFPMGMCLSIGDIKETRESFLKEFYQFDGYAYTSILNELAGNITEGTMIRIWSSKKNDDDYMLLLFLCDFLKTKQLNMSVVFCSDYSNCVSSINALNYKEIEPVLSYEKKLTEEDIQEYANKWADLVKVNSELRILENGEVKSKSYSDYYDNILNSLRERMPCTIANLVGDCMVKRLINDAGDMLYSLIIDQLIELNKIKIVSKGERHFVDTIALV